MFNREYIIFDGGMGTMLQDHGLKPGGSPELMNLEQPEAVFQVHSKYVASGTDFITTNTFGGNRLKLEEYGLENQVFEINKRAAQIAKKAAGKKAKVAGSIGPTGYFMEPLGEMSFDRAYEVFVEQVEGLVAGQVDCLIFETFNDLGELRAGIIAAKDTCSLPIIASLTYEGNKTLTGVSPESAAIILDSLGVDAISANCSGGPKELLPIIESYLENTNKAIMVQPNAGIPELRNGEVYFPLDPQSFMEEMRPYFNLGLKFFGSCCGSNPAHTRLYRETLEKYHENPRREKRVVALSSKSKPLYFGETNMPRLIGERINPTARKKLAESIRNDDLSMIQDEAYKQKEEGAHLLDINLGVPGIDQKQKMKEVINLVQQGLDIPLVIDSTTPEVIEEALKYYQGKALINSVNGEQESMDSILPLAKKYGASIIALTLDENGIPKTKEQRFEIAEKIINKAYEHGLKSSDIFVDCLVMTVGTNDLAAKETLDTVRLIKEKLNVGAVLGVSNVSHGLPNRSKINSAFLAMSIYNGLDMGIVNPGDSQMIAAWEAASLLSGRDPHAKSYLEKNTKEVAKEEVFEEEHSLETVKKMVIRGSKKIVEEIEILLEDGIKPLEIINEGLIQGLNFVGEKFEKGEYYLPQLMLSAETSQNAFTYLESVLGEEGKMESKGTIIIGTVKGDVHDIGKNMVVVMLKNHGYEVIDMGKNVDADQFLEGIQKYSPEVVALSALMTTTMIEIPKVTKAVKEKYPEIKVICGGAVVTEEFSKNSGADAYCRDAVNTVTIVEGLKEDK